MYNSVCLTRLKLSYVFMSSLMWYCSSTTTPFRPGLCSRAQSSQWTIYVFLLLLSLVTNSRLNTSTCSHTHTDTYINKNISWQNIICHQCVECWWSSRRTRCSSTLAHPSPCSDRRSSSLQTPAGPSKSECVWWTGGDNVWKTRQERDVTINSFKVGLSDTNHATLHSLDHLECVWVCDFGCAGDVPGHVNHGDNWFDFLDLVPLKAFKSQLILIGWKDKEHEASAKYIYKCLVDVFGAPYCYTVDSPFKGPTFQAMLLHQPTAWTQCTAPALIHTRSPGLWMKRYTGMFERYRSSRTGHHEPVR